ncbi:uncharacterized protein [Setaria viridis]|uniref:uncharacterized protein n=1 Tax=Setaria viridis TaxID=4556 RepID=UPI003B3A6945
MDTYCAEVCKLEAHFNSLEFHHIHSEHNVAADVLSKLNSKRAQVPAGMFIQDLRKPSIKILDPDQADSNAQPQADLASADVLIIQVEEDWQAPFIAFITDNMSPEDKAEHKKLARRSTNYIVQLLDYFLCNLLIPVGQLWKVIKIEALGNPPL